MSSSLVSPIKLILIVILLAIFWEFFVGNQDFVRDFSNKNFNKQTTFLESSKKDIIVDVKRVVDGDTFVIDIDNKGQDLKVRLIGVNTPESVDPRRPVECMGQEASLFLRDNIEGKKIYIQTDNTQGQYDKYGRLLGYVSNMEGEDINKKVIINGYGYEYTFDKSNPYTKQQEYKQAENLAKFSKRGLWDSNKCKLE